MSPRSPPDLTAHRARLGGAARSHALGGIWRARLLWRSKGQLRTYGGSRISSFAPRPPGKT
eukprot:3310823-Alexandrium_andersonii.AAC.1